MAILMRLTCEMCERSYFSTPLLAPAAGGYAGVGGAGGLEGAQLTVLSGCFVCHGNHIFRLFWTSRRENLFSISGTAVCSGSSGSVPSLWRSSLSPKNKKPAFPRLLGGNPAYLPPPTLKLRVRGKRSRRIDDEALVEVEGATDPGHVGVTEMCSGHEDGYETLEDRADDTVEGTGESERDSSSSSDMRGEDRHGTSRAAARWATLCASRTASPTVDWYWVSLVST